MLLVALSLTACTSVIEEYQAESTLVQTPPAPAPENWMPDAAIQLSQPLLDELLTAALNPAPKFEGKIDATFASLLPMLTVNSLKLGAASSCTECLQLDVDIGGSLGVSSLLGSTTANASIGCKVDAALAITKTETGYAIGAVPRAVHDVHVNILGLKAGVNLDGPITSFIQTSVLANLPPFPLTEIGTDTAPVRAVKITSQNQVLRVDLLSGARTPGAVPLILPPPKDGFSVDVSLQSLLAIAQAEAFHEGPMTYGLLAEPTALNLNGDQFDIGLRLWKTTGKGWWRDYAITGTYGLDGQDFVMKPAKVEEKGHSPGAAVADPLIAMTSGLVQHAIKNAVNTTTPASSGQLGSMGAEILLTGFQGAAGILHVDGTVRFPTATYGGGVIAQ
jgi:hypothetical protein